MVVVVKSLFILIGPLPQSREPGLLWAPRKPGWRAYGNHAVTLKVAPFLRIECKFWLTDDGWNGCCEQPPIIVQAGSFEHAKSEMEIALGKYVESLLREPQRTSNGQAA